jgi:hypothetical protein
MSTAVEKPPGKPRAMARVLFNPINLGVAAGAATLAFGLGSIAIGALGALAYAAMVAYDALTPSASKPAKLTSASLPDPKTITDPDTRAAVERILESKADLEKVLDETPPDVIANLSTTLASLHELETYAARLVERGEDLTRHLKGVDLGDLVAEVKQAAARAEAASDPDAKKTFEEAKATRMDEIRTLRELRTAKERIDANLMRVVAVLGALPTKVVHMRALDAQAMDRISGDMNTELAAVGDELKTSEAVIKQLGEVTTQ